MKKVVVLMGISVLSVILAICIRTQIGNSVKKQFSIVNSKNYPISSDLSILMSEEMHETGSDILINYQSPFCFKMYTIPSELIKYVGEKEFEKYLQSYYINVVDKNYLPTSVNEAPSVFSFIQWFDISEKKFSELLSKVNQSENLSEEYKYLDSDIKVLYSNDIGMLNEYFASEYCIVADGYIYTPEWIVNHSNEDILAAGIDKNMIVDKIHFYESLPLSKKIRIELQKKISQICEKEIILDFSKVYEYYPVLAFEDSIVTGVGKEYSALEVSELNIEECIKYGIDKNDLFELLTKLENYKTCIEYKKIQELFQKVENKYENDGSNYPISEMDGVDIFSFVISKTEELTED